MKLKKMSICFFFPLVLFAGKSPIKRLLPIDIESDYSLFIILLIGLIFFMLIQKKMFYIPKNKMLFYFFLFYFFYLLSIVYSPDKYLALKKSLLIFSILLMCGLINIAIKSVEDIDDLLKGFVFLGSIFALLAIPNLSNLGRVSVLGGGPNVFGRFMFLGLISSFFLFEQKKKKIYFFLSFIFLIFMISSGSRGVYLGSFAVMLIYIVMNIKKLNIKKIIKNTFLSAISFLFFFLLFSKQLLYFYNNRIVYLFSDPAGGQSVMTRKAMYSEAYDLFLRHPIIGNGASSFESLSIFEIYPHNIVLELLSENGVVGLILFLLLIFISISSFFNILKNAAKISPIFYKYNILLFSIIVFFFLSAQFSGDLFDSRFLFFFIIVYGSLYRLVQTDYRRKNI